MKAYLVWLSGARSVVPGGFAPLQRIAGRVAGRAGETFCGQRDALLCSIRENAEDRDDPVPYTQDRNKSL